MSEKIIELGLKKIEGLKEFMLKYSIKSDVNDVSIIEDGTCEIPSEMSRNEAIELIKKGEAFPIV